MGRSGALLTGAAVMVRVVTAALLVGSGVLSYAGSRERWGGVCGDWEAPACLRVQDHRYDYLAPSAPWTPLGDAAQYAGVALLLLAAAFLVLPALLFRGRPVVTLAVGAATSLGILVVAWSTWQSGVTGRPVETRWLPPAGLWWALAWPLACLVLALQPRRTSPRRGRGWRIAVVTALLMASPIPMAMLSVGPYDSAPWYEALGGGLVLLAGCALWPATARGGASRARAAEPAPAPLPTA